jgi:hypothetical protein
LILKFHSAAAPAQARLFSNADAILSNRWEPYRRHGFSPIVMSKRFEDQSWYPEWKKTIDRVVAARMALDATQPGTLERETANREYEAALAAFRLVAEKQR